MAKEAAKNVKETISDFLEFLQQRRIWREGEEYHDSANPEKMMESVEAIRTNLTDVINRVRRENYENPELLTDMQDACLDLLDAMDRNHRRLEEDQNFGATDFFWGVRSQLSVFQNVVVDRFLNLCKDQNLCGKSPCRRIC